MAGKLLLATLFICWGVSVKSWALAQARGGTSASWGPWEPNVRHWTSVTGN